MDCFSPSPTVTDVKELHKLAPSRDFLWLSGSLCTLIYLSTTVPWVAVSRRSQVGHCFYPQHVVASQGWLLSLLYSCGTTGLAVRWSTLENPMENFIFKCVQSDYSVMGFTHVNPSWGKIEKRLCFLFWCFELATKRELNNGNWSRCLSEHVENFLQPLRETAWFHWRKRAAEMGLGNSPRWMRRVRTRADRLFCHPQA